ncbi:MAG: AlwI family type II restriction endonuclease [Clostridia bacterium]|nr:AlwI family type II restriction endonuclease [Clostridia bacterium]
MPKCWSLSTTIRNPERNIPFLRVLSEFEGQVFDEDVQIAFFKRLIQTKEYKPEGLPQRFVEMYEDPEEFTEEELNDLLSNVHYKNKQYNDDQEKIYAFRGRTAVGNLNKMGMVVARGAIGEVAITKLGKEILSGAPNFENIFLRYCLKWQLQNPGERGYSNFNIIPFIATLHVINRVNKLWSKMGNKPVGLAKDEFSLFIPVMTDYRNIEEVVRRIIDFREAYRSRDNNERKIFLDNCFRETAISVFELQEDGEVEIVKKVNNLYDYGDSAIRYFRQTNLLYYRGSGRYIDLSPTRMVEINKLLKEYDGSTLEFSSIDDYIEYMADTSLPVLPWENQEDLTNVYLNLLSTAQELDNRINSNYKGQALHSFDISFKEFDSVGEYSSAIEQLRSIIKTLTVDLSILEERSFGNLNRYMQELDSLANRKRSITGQDPLNLEWYTCLTLMALDDAKEINPHYSVGDDNLPLFTAPGNTADIECYYEDFNTVCEVTLLRGRDQWFNEGQPVMRHFRDFEGTQVDKPNYCLFIAPLIHRDTLNTFWFSIKMGFEGHVQKIIPLTITQYNRVLQIALEKKENNGVRINSKNIKGLLDMIFDDSKNYMDSTIWAQNIDSLIEDWGNKIA